MEMYPVNSTAIESIGYDAQTRRMKIKFIQGETYTFCNVPQSVFDNFLKASSKGTYYNDYIKDKFQCSNY